MCWSKRWRIDDVAQHRLKDVARASQHDPSIP
jgi:hypothetical protein